VTIGPKLTELWTVKVDLFCPIELEGPFSSGVKLERVLDLSKVCCCIMADVALFVASVALYTLEKLLRAEKCIAGEKNVHLKEMLINRTSINARELICTVSPDNVVLPSGALRADMRLHNLWHRATYVLIIVLENATEGTARETSDEYLDATNIIVQRRSVQKDYCPRKLDPLPGGVVQFQESYRDNAIRELQEEMGIDVNARGNSLVRIFAFPFENERVKVWGEFFECRYHGRIDDLILQEEEVESAVRMSLRDLRSYIDNQPQEFMPDACHAMRLYFQRLADVQVKRRLLKGYSSGDLDSYQLRPRPQVIFFDCDDCLYFDGWVTANKLTSKIDEWCVKRGLKQGQAYALYKKYGTALRGLLAEGYIENTERAVDHFLQSVHDIPVRDLLTPDMELRSMLERMDPTIPKYIFTASVKEHADRCIDALGIADLFVEVIDCKRCDLETKHSKHSFLKAMEVAGVDDPERCIFFDDNLKNIAAARQIGWRSVLVGTVGRDCGNRVTSDHAEHDIERIHHIPHIMPELFVQMAEAD
jgi:pyrimidine 5'-nucleotidase